MVVPFSLVSKQLHRSSRDLVCPFEQSCFERAHLLRAAAPVVIGKLPADSPVEDWTNFLGGRAAELFRRVLFWRSSVFASQARLWPVAAVGNGTEVVKLKWVHPPSL